MKLLVFSIASVLIFGLSLIALDKLTDFPSGYPMNWIPWLSLSLVMFGAFAWSRATKVSLAVLVVATAFSLGLVFVSDVAVAVAYSCSQGDCL